MNHQDGFAVKNLIHRKILMAQPMEHLTKPGRLQHVIQRVIAVRFSNAIGKRQQVQVVITQKAPRAALESHQPIQHCNVLRPTVDKVAQQKNPVAAR